MMDFEAWAWDKNGDNPINIIALYWKKKYFENVLPFNTKYTYISLYTK